MGRLFSRRKYRDLMLGLALLCAVLALMRWPQESMAAARDGLALCGNVIICLGGGISNAEDDLLLDPLRGLVLAGCFDKSKPPRLERASLGNDAGVVGAAMLYKML